MSNYMTVTYRQIAKVMVKPMLLEDQEFGDKVNEYVDTLERLPLNHQLALKAAYIFAGISPREEQEDCFQDYYLAVLKANTTIEALAYTIAKRRWIDSYRRYKRHSGLRVQLPAIACEVDPLEQVESISTADSIWQALPSKIKAIVNKRMSQQPLTNIERASLSRYKKYNGQNIRALAI